jgi:hypothetical protein
MPPVTDATASFVADPGPTAWPGLEEDELIPEPTVPVTPTRTTRAGIKRPRPKPAPKSTVGKSSAADTKTRPRPTPPPSVPHPGRPAAKPVIRRRRRVGTGIRWLIIIGLAVGGYQSRNSWLPALHRYAQSLSQHGTPSPGPTSAARSGPACPENVANRLPSGERDAARLVETHKTSGFYITLCTGTSGKLFYYGISRSDSSMWIALPATRSGSDYIATNNGYRYDVEPRKLVVTKGGKVVVNQTFTS